MYTLSDGRFLSFKLSGINLSNNYNLSIYVHSESGVPINHWGVTLGYWAYSSCGCLMLRGLNGLLVHDHLYKEIYKLLYDYLTGPDPFMDGYNTAGQITWVASDSQMLVEKSWQRYMVDHHVGGVTKCVHQYHNMAHPDDPENHKSGNLMQVFWHHKYPDSLPP
jgi:hypothetical protein